MTREAGRKYDPKPWLLQVLFYVAVINWLPNAWHQLWSFLSIVSQECKVWELTDNPTRLEVVAPGNSFYCGAYAIHILHACLRGMIGPSTEINLSSYLADVTENWEIFGILLYSRFLHLKMFLVDLKWFLMQETISWEVLTSPTVVLVLEIKWKIEYAVLGF